MPALDDNSKLTLAPTLGGAVFDCRRPQGAHYGIQVDSGSLLGSRFRELAERMMGTKAAATEKKRGFIDILTRKKEIEAS